MELNWSTFVLEIINFIILVWIMKHFFYKPVLNIIARRKNEIEQTLEEAKRLHDHADSLRGQYENRLHEWEREKQQARDDLKKEIDEQRKNLLQELYTSLEQEREKRRVSDRQQLQVEIDKAEETALTHGAQFASKLLQSVTGPELETRLLDLIINDLDGLPQERIHQLQEDWGEKNYEANIYSAYPLSDTQHQQIEKVLSDLTQRSLSFHYDQDSELLAGVLISIGAWTLSANLRDELKSFARFNREF